MRSPSGASAAIVGLARQGQVTLLVSVALALEYEAVCGRPEHRLAADLNQDEVNVFVDAIVALAEPFTMHFLWRPQLTDACDEMVLETAINGDAEALVTFNARDFGAAPGHFGVDLLLPREAVMRIRQED
jgi:predicted nucleic acid-binding protein